MGRTPDQGTRIDEAEFAILVSDAWQGKGLGTNFSKNARADRDPTKMCRPIVGYIMAENLIMRRVSEEVGFKLHKTPGLRRRIAGRDHFVKVAVFSAKRYDIEFLNAANNGVTNFTFSSHILTNTQLGSPADLAASVSS